MAGAASGTILRERIGPRDIEDDEVLTALRGAHRAMHELLHTSLAGFTLIPTEYRALAELSRRGELTPTSLSTALEITPASTTGLLDRLERRQLVRRRPNPLDRRSMLVGLTSAGVGAYTAARAGYRRSISRVSTGMTKSGREALIQGIGEFLRVFQQSNRSRQSPGATLGRRAPTLGS